MAVDVNAIRQRIALINRETESVNTMRNQNIGQKTTLEKQCAELFAQYKEKFGVELTADNIGEELQRVAAEKENEANLIGGVLNALANKDYALANKLMGVNTGETEAPKSEVPQQTTETQQTVQTQQRVLTQPVVSSTSVEKPAAPIVSNTATSFQQTDTVGVPPMTNVASSTDVVGTPPMFTPAQPAKPVSDDIVAPPSFPKKPIGSPSMQGISNGDFMSGVSDEPKAPISALEGFTHTQTQGHTPMTGLEMPKLDNAQPSSAPNDSAPKQFSSIVSGVPFNNR